MFSFVIYNRHDICANDESGCGLAGLAYVATACTGNKNCAINEDLGLVLGIIVAHEMGHVYVCIFLNYVVILVLGDNKIVV